MWIYIMSEPNLYTVGFYDPTGQFHADEDFGDRTEARRRVNLLNGGPYAPR